MVDSRRPTLVEDGHQPGIGAGPGAAAGAAAGAGDRSTFRGEASRTRSERDETTDERSEREVRRLLAALDAKERELASLRAERLGATPDRYLPDQAFISTPVSGVTRAAQPQRSLLPEFEQVDVAAGTQPAAAPHQEYDDECERLQEALNKGRSKIIQLEEEIFELKCARRRHGSGEVRSLRFRLGGRSLSRLTGSALLGAGGPGSGDPFPGIVRLTETKLQEAYQLLVRERQRAGQLTKQASEAAQRLEKTAAAAAELKQQLARSVQERQQLQGQLTAAETAGTGLRQQLQKLREEVQSKDTQLSRTSHHLEERVAQVTSLSRELEAAREEAVRQERAAAVRQDDLLTRVTQLEQTADTLRLENKRLGQARDEAGHLAASERRLRQRVTELQERLDQSNNTAKMLENYIHFLKSSYNSMFGAPTAAGGSPGVGSLASSDGHGAARGLFHLSGK
ncbi:Outer dense fiber protein 2 [Amphibalanus amphitrite]|uniref:Outer dense fiber protein 2 n=1 Tax=Amphibalanus amphitrite TaxID=1232801 RepID=A0A6A4XEC5_AMPAM|nr:Outer dense fiber protein 2 [Amphibalanus amphitrite]